MRHAFVVLLCLPLLLMGCGDERKAPRPTAAAEPAGALSSGPATDDGLPEVVEWDRQGAAPPVTLHLGGEQHDLGPWTTCYGNGCADGIPPSDPFDVGDRDEVLFTFPDAGWDFTAIFTQVGPECPRSFDAEVQEVADRTYRVAPLGPPGTYDVHLAGEGAGDHHTTFRWTTGAAGVIDPPAGQLGIVAYDDEGTQTSYGVEMFFTDLADLSEHATATVTVTDGNGVTTTVGPLRSTGCTTTGSFGMREKGRAQGRAIARSGPAPFDYEVRLALDGLTYVGTSRWPDDEVDAFQGYTPLTFDPPLPAYSG